MLLQLSKSPRALAAIVLLMGATALLAQTPKTREQRIRAVENGLITYVPVKGFAAWNLQERMRYYEVPGLTIAVVHNYKVDWVKAYGVADLASGKPTEMATMFSAGSVSKLANGVLAMRLVQEGKLKLDSPVNDFLTGWKIPDNEFTRKTPPTLRMLLAHTAGTTQSAFFGYQPGQKLPTTAETLSGAAPSENRPVVVNSAPGNEFRYSGGGTLICQLAAMDVTGSDYAELIRQRIFVPVGMTSSTMQQPLPANFAARASWAYSDTSWFTGVPYVYPQSAAAGLYSTARDLALLLIEIQNAYRGRKARVLTQASATEMLKPQTSVSAGTYLEHTGLGVFLLQLQTNRQGDAGRYFGHTGVNAGFVADALGSVTGGNGVVVMANKDGAAMELLKEIRRSVARTYNWQEFLPPQVELMAVGMESLDRLVGRYQRGPDEVVSMRREGDVLIENINGGRDIICVPQSATSCVLTDFGVAGKFKLGTAGRAESFQIVGISTEMPRLRDEQLLPNELIRAGRIEEAVSEYKKANLSEFQLTMMANDLIFSKPANLAGAGGLLALADAQHPNSAIVSRVRGTLAEKLENKQAAIDFYRRTLAIDPADQDAARRLKRLTVPGK